MTIVIDTEIIELFRVQWWHLQCKFGIKVFDLNTYTSDKDRRHCRNMSVKKLKVVDYACTDQRAALSILFSKIFVSNLQINR